MFERYQQLCKDDPDNVVFDFGFRYMGMDMFKWLYVIYDHLLFCHDDGQMDGKRSKL